MKTYLLTLIFLSFLSGALLYLMKDSKYEKHLRYLCSLILLLYLVSPLKNLLSDGLPSLTGIVQAQPEDVYSNAYGQTLLLESRRALEEELSAQIEKSARLTGDEFGIEVQLTLDGSELSIEKIVCRLRSVRAVAQREKIAETLAAAGEKPVFIEEL